MRVRLAVTDRAAASAELGSGVLVAMAVACGLMAANLYYAQPLAGLIGASLGMAPAASGFVVTLAQFGYCIGLVLVVPLADVVENRTLVLWLGIGAAAGLVLAGSAQGQAQFLLAAALIGICSVGAQVLVPLASRLSPPDRQGAAIGRVMAGLLAGIMLARPFASFVADLAGWRAAFLLPSAAVLAIAVALYRALPRVAPSGRSSYLALVRSLPGYFTAFAPLRRRCLYQALLFATFNLFWTAAPLVLGERFGLRQSGIALFALAGAGGALAAPLAGRLIDRGLVRVGTGCAIALVAVTMAASQGIVAVQALVPLAVLAVLLDGGTQANQVLSQSVIYRLAPHARGRINAVYMTSIFIGGGCGSALAPFLYRTAGWAAVMACGVVLCLVAFVAWLVEPRDVADPVVTADRMV